MTFLRAHGAARVRETATQSSFPLDDRQGDGSLSFHPALLEAMAGGERRLARLFLAAPRLGVSAQTALVAPEAPNDRVYWLRAGWACRYRFVPDGRRQILSIHLPGDLLGLDSLLMPDPLDTVEALTKCTYYALDLDTFRAALAEPEIALWIVWLMTQERQRIDARATSIGRCSAEERVSAFLLELYERLRRLQLLNGRSFFCPLTQRHVADCLGITIVHANRVLKRLQASGVVSMQYRTVVIQDFERLRHIARPVLTGMATTATAGFPPGEPALVAGE